MTLLQTYRSRPSCLFGLLAGLSLVTACSRTAQTPQTPSSPDVWATVDGREIRKAEVEKAYSSSVEPQPTPPSAEEVLGAKLNLVDELINQDLLLARARAAGLETTAAEVDKVFLERKGNIPDDQFQLQISQRGLTIDDVKENLRRELTIQKLLDRDVIGKVAVSDQDITDFYNANRAQFNLQEPQYRLAQIGITPVKDPQLRNRKNDDAGTPAEAKRKADMLLEQLKGGASFSELALDYSEDPQTAGRGGDLGFVPASALSQVNPQLRATVLKMQPGSVNLVTIGGSYTLLMLVAHEPAGQRDLSHQDVKTAISDMLRSRREELLRAAYIGTLRNGAEITNHLARQISESPAAIPANLLSATPAR